MKTPPSGITHHPWSIEQSPQTALRRLGIDAVAMTRDEATSRLRRTIRYFENERLRQLARDISNDRAQEGADLEKTYQNVLEYLEEQREQANRERIEIRNF